ncbi:MAG: pilus assembly protein N-terminal domain-containing protein [Paracoccaceae bacterium]
MCKTPCWPLSVSADHRLRVFVRHVAWCVTVFASLCSGVAAAQDASRKPTQVVAARIISDDRVSRQITVFADFAVVLQIAGDVSAIVLGNADIADASVVAARTIVLTGKAVGTTNVMVLGPDGEVLAEFYVQVPGHKPGTITVRRALLANSYVCTASSCKYSGTGPERGTATE